MTASWPTKSNTLVVAAVAATSAAATMSTSNVVRFQMRVLESVLAMVGTGGEGVVQIWKVANSCATQTLLACLSASEWEECSKASAISRASTSQPAILRHTSKGPMIGE